MQRARAIASLRPARFVHANSHEYAYAGRPRIGRGKKGTLTGDTSLDLPVGKRKQESRARRRHDTPERARGETRRTFERAGSAARGDGDGARRSFAARRKGTRRRGASDRLPRRAASDARTSRVTSSPVAGGGRGAARWRRRRTAPRCTSSSWTTPGSCADASTKVRRARTRRRPARRIFSPCLLTSTRREMSSSSSLRRLTTPRPPHLLPRRDSHDRELRPRGHGAPRARHAVQPPPHGRHDAGRRRAHAPALRAE
eukprot:30224-Pelagococcus_subviridis.AAC.2